MQIASRVRLPRTDLPLVEPPTQRLESQTLRALLQMRELLLRGEFRPGERLREIPLAAGSRSPHALRRCWAAAQAGLRPRGPPAGRRPPSFTVQDIHDGIGSEACRGTAPSSPRSGCRATRIRRTEPAGAHRSVSSAGRRAPTRWRIITLNEQCPRCGSIWSGARARRAVDRAGLCRSRRECLHRERAEKEGRAVVTISREPTVDVDAIANREPTRAEAIASEQSDGRPRLEMAARQEDLDAGRGLPHQIPRGGRVH